MYTNALYGWKKISTNIFYLVWPCNPHKPHASSSHLREVHYIVCLFVIHLNRIILISVYKAFVFASGIYVSSTIAVSGLADS